MKQELIILPVFIQVLLTVIVLLVMGVRRQRSLAQLKLKPNDIALGQKATWTDEALKASNNYANQFELPVLFYAVCAFALILRGVDYVFFALACIFVATRLVHAVIHLGQNDVSKRALVFLIGGIIVSTLWIILVVRVLGSMV